MAKDNLEDKIINNVYSWERQRTARTVVRYTIWLAVLALILAAAGWQVWDILASQQTLDLLELFGEDMDIIRENILDIIFILLYESPKLWLLVWLAALVVLAVIGFSINRNFAKIKNRILTLRNYKGKKRH